MGERSTLTLSSWIAIAGEIFIKKSLQTIISLPRWDLELDAPFKNERSQISSVRCLALLLKSVEEKR